MSIEGEGTWLRPPSAATGGAFSGARLELAADYVISTGSFVQFPWDTTVFDTDSYVGSLSGDVCFVIPATGYYVLQAVEDWFIDNRTSARTTIKTFLTSAAIGEIAKDEITLDPSTPAITYPVMFNLNSGPVHLSAADTVQLSAQDTVHADTVNGTTFGGVTYWTIMRVG